jgi:hypothetical protein
MDFFRARGIKLKKLIVKRMCFLNFYTIDRDNRVKWFHLEIKITAAS